MTLRQHEVQSLTLPITHHFGHLTVAAFYSFLMFFSVVELSDWKMAVARTQVKFAIEDCMCVYVLL